MDDVPFLNRMLMWLEQPATITAAGFLLVLVYAMRTAGRYGLNPMIMYWAGVWGIFGALLGGRLIMLFQEPSAGIGDYLDPAVLISGQRSIIGAFAGAAVAAVLYLRIKKAAVTAYADRAVAAVALGCFVARIGCFVNGDCFGVVSDVPWAVHFAEGTEAYHVHAARGWIEPGDGTSSAVHPVQLYHAAAALFGFFLFSRLRPLWPGHNVVRALVFYGATRFFMQYYRDDHWIDGAAVDTAQWFCLLLIGFGVAGFIGRKWMEMTNHTVAYS